jgi:hypothetical protein
VNVQVGGAVNLRTGDAMLFMQGGPSFGAGLSVGPGATLQKGSLNDVVAPTGKGGGTNLTVTGGAVSGSVLFSERNGTQLQKPTGIGVGTRSLLGAFWNFSSGGSGTATINLLKPADRSYECGKVGTGYRP